MKEKIRKLTEKRLGRRPSVKYEPRVVANRHCLDSKYARSFISVCVCFKIWYIIGMRKMCEDFP